MILSLGLIGTIILLIFAIRNQLVIKRQQEELVDYDPNLILLLNSLWYASQEDSQKNFKED
jgi:hypothetical protein